jgi:hypothetical protein
VIFQFTDDEGRDVLVSLDPEVAEYTDMVAIGDQCLELIPGNEFEIEPRHPLPDESYPLPDRQ